MQSYRDVKNSGMSICHDPDDPLFICEFSSVVFAEVSVDQLRINILIYYSEIEDRYIDILFRNCYKCHQSFHHSAYRQIKF